MRIEAGGCEVEKESKVHRGEGYFPVGPTAFNPQGMRDVWKFTGGGVRGGCMVLELGNTVC